MIYLFDKEKQLNKALPLNHFSSAHQVKIINGAYTVDLVTPLKFTKRGTVYNHKKAFDKSDFVGHFDENNRFQLYRITNVKVDNNTVNAIGVHIFFDEAKAKTIIHDRRWRDSELRPIADFALGEIGWNLLECDVTDRYNFNIFRGSILDFRKDAIETYKVEMDYEIGFDGQKITSKGVRIKNRLGEETGERFAYGSNVLKITAEQDRSEVYTAVIGRGRGEESGDGYGQRIEFENVVWSTSNGDPVDKPAGQNYVELPAATEEYGYYENGAIQPRIAVIEFDDIEDENLLITESWEWLLQNSLPKAVFSSDVFTLGNYNLGDSIGIIYKDAGIIKKARVQKIDINLQDNRKTSFELGDYKHFKPDTFGKVRGELKKQQRKTSEMLTRLKNMFDEDFNRVEQEMNDSFNNALAEAEAKVQASEARMNDIISTNRTEIMQEVETSKQEAIQTAEQNAEAKKQEVQNNLDSFKDVHQQLYDSVTADIMDIDDFIGDKTENLNEILSDIQVDFETKINNINTWHYNMLRDTRFKENLPTRYGGAERMTDEHDEYYRLDSTKGSNVGIRLRSNVTMQPNVEYTFSIDYRTDSVPELDRIGVFRNDGSFFSMRNFYTDAGDIENLTTNGEWNRGYFKFSLPVEETGQFYIATHFNWNDTTPGIIDIKLPYLTATNNTEWLYHQTDASQNIEEVVNRVTNLEDGYSQLITRTEFDSKTGEITGDIRTIESTVNSYSDTIASHEDWIITNGSDLLRTADEVSSKVWLGDIDNPNIIPFSVFSSGEARNKWSEWGTWGETYGGRFDDYAIVGDRNSSSNLGIISPEIGEYVTPGETYTLSWEATVHYPATTDIYFDYMYLTNIGSTNYSHKLPAPQSIDIIGTGTNVVYRRYELTFTMPDEVKPDTQVLFGTHTTENNINAFFRFRHPKLEEGPRASPFITSYSMLEQRADTASLAVQGLGSQGFLKQSDLTITADYWQLGSKRVDGDTVASVLRGTPGSIDAIVDEMNLTGNLNVSGQIESISMSAVKAEFADLFAAQVRAGTINVDYISGLTAEFERMYTLNANIERLVSQHVFTNSVKTLSLDAVNANISSIRSNILTSDVILSGHINSSNALIDKIFSSDAYIDRLTSKTAFIRDIQAIEVTLNQLNVNTIMDEAGKINGGISIRRPDGAVAINNGMLRNEYVVSAYNPNFMSQTHQGLSCFYTSGAWWVTSQRVQKDMGSSMNFNAYQFVHSARYLEIEIGYRRHQTGFHMRIDSFSTSPSFSGYRGFVKSGGGSTEYHVMKIDLGVPDYRRKAFYLKLELNGQATDDSDQLWFRILRVVQTDF